MFFVHIAFADDLTFFLNDLLSVKNLINTFKVFSLFSGLKAKFSKCDRTKFSKTGLRGSLGFKIH